MTSEEQKRLAEYQRISDIGKKSEAVLVEHIPTGKRYVRKVLLLYDADVYRMIREERIPQIPGIRELIEDEGKLIIIEEYIEGRNLEEMLEERLFTEQETREIICRLCRILAPLHEHVPQIVHRDIKPSNLILDTEGKLWLIDFDASRDLEPDKSQDTVLMGTQEYAAPEQYGFTQSTERTDIYAMGVLMNRMMTGRFPREQLAGGRLGPVIEKCTQMDPSKRYRSTAALEEALKNSHGSLRPPGFRSRGILRRIGAGVGYFFVLWLAVTMEVKGQDGTPAGMAETIANRIAVGVIMFGWIFYLGNYLGVRNRFPWRRGKRAVIEVIRILLGMFLIFAIPVIVLGLLFPLS